MLIVPAEEFITFKIRFHRQTIPVDLHWRITFKTMRSLHGAKRNVNLGGESPRRMEPHSLCCVMYFWGDL